MHKSLKLGLYLVLQISVASCSFKKVDLKTASPHEEVATQRTITLAKLLSNDQKELLDLVRFGSSDELTRFLTTHSIDLNFSDADGNMPIGLAKSRGARAIFDLLVKHGASIYQFEERNPDNLSYLAESHWPGASPNDPEYKLASDELKQAPADEAPTNSSSSNPEPESDASYINSYLSKDFYKNSLIIREALTKKDFLTIKRTQTTAGISCDLISFSLLQSLQYLPAADLTESISAVEKYLHSSGCKISSRYSLAVDLYRSEWMRQIKSDSDDPSILDLINRVFPDNPREIQVHPFNLKMVLIKINPRFLFLMYNKKITSNLDIFVRNLKLPEGFNYSAYSPDGIQDVSTEAVENSATSGKECLISFLDDHPLYHCSSDTFYDENSDYHQSHPKKE